MNCSARSVFAALTLLALATACGTADVDCPDGSVRQDLRCVPTDAGDRDADLQDADLDDADLEDADLDDADLDDADLIDADLEDALDACGLLFYYDGDGDGFGDEAVTCLACAASECGEGYVARGRDCDDACATCYPGSREVCDARDNDCDETIDEDNPRTFYRDQDEDGYGDRFQAMEASCDPPSGYVEDDTDCADLDSRAHPGATTWRTTHVTGKPDDDFDFNCDGDNELEYPYITGEVAEADFCKYFAISCFDFAWTRTSLPPCGDRQRRVHCNHQTSPLYVCVRDPMYAYETVACR